MESVNFDPRSLPSEPTTYQIWQKDWPHYLSAYNLAFDAEKYATQQPEGPTKDKNIMFARAAGFFLVELFNRHAILTVGPCEQLSKELQSKDREGGTANDVVFKVGKFYRDVFLRLCAFHFFHKSFGILMFLQSGQPPRRTPHPPRLLLAIRSTI